MLTDGGGSTNPSACQARMVARFPTEDKSILLGRGRSIIYIIWVARRVYLICILAIWGSRGIPPATVLHWCFWGASGLLELGKQRFLILHKLIMKGDRSCRLIIVGIRVHGELLLVNCELFLSPEPAHRARLRRILSTS